MSEHIAQVSLVLTVLAPLLLALLTVWRPARAWCVRLAPLAFLPALATVFLSPAEITFDALLLGTHLALDPMGRIFLLLSAVLWTTAAVFGRAWLANDPERATFFGFFLGAAAGNLGVCIAQDIASFYFLFALMTFSAWGMVQHRRSPQARRAGRVYVALAVLGEAALLAALLLIAASGATLLANAPTAVADSPARDAIVALLLIGFGVKTGVLGLHMTLPLAYAATPAPGAAVLASAMIKAGLLGWLRFLPLGHDLPEWSAVFVIFGVAAAFYGVVVGVLQREPRVILAYSSVSQMGLIMLAVGAALAGPTALEPALLAITAYTLHHAFCKGALFLGEALLRVTRARRWVLAGLALPAAALAGVPFSSGALAKHLLKDSVSLLPWAEALPYILSAAAVGTTLLMCRFLWCVRSAPDAAAPGATAQLVVPWLVVLAAVLGAGFFPQTPHVSLSSFADAAWPVLLGVIVAIGAARVLRISISVPPGDILGPIERALSTVRGLDAPSIAESRWRLAWPTGAVEQTERALRSWGVVGLLLFLLLGVFIVLLAW